jgi:hypothetical protein
VLLLLAGTEGTGQVSQSHGQWDSGPVPLDYMGRSQGDRSLSMFIGRLSESDMTSVDHRLRIILGLDLQTKDD